MSKGSILAGVLTIVIAVTATTIVVTMINTVMEEGAAYNTYDQAKQMLSVVDYVIEELSVESQGATRVLDLRTTGGELTVSGKEDRIKFRLDKALPGVEPGTRTKEQNMIISYGPYLKAYEADINSDGFDDLVLENEGVLFAVRKLGNVTDHTFVNTTNFITLIRNKIADNNITPVSGIYLRALDNSSYGQGYTELTKTGDFLPSASIRLVMNSASGLYYEALFTLAGAHDFVELQVKNIV